MSLGVQLEDDRKCCATVVGLDLLSGLSKRDVVYQTGLSNVVLFPLFSAVTLIHVDRVVCFTTAIRICLLYTSPSPRDA